MPLVTLICAGLLGWTDDTTPPVPDVTAAYRQAEASSGRTPADQIRLALWCEARGLTAERVRHLTLAVLADPTNATARGLAGLVARDGRWVRPDTVARTVQDDPARLALLAEYDEKRSQTPYTADDQWALGVWSDERGLIDQARAHFTAVTRLDPGRDVAWKRLGYKKVAGQWTTDAQLAAAKAEADAQKEADRTWKPRLEKWQGMLAQPSRRDEAQAALLGVSDPRAVRAIDQVFGNGAASHQLTAVRLFGQIASVDASLALANLAVWGQSPEVRRVATETLTQRDPREFVSALISKIRTPWQFEVRPVNGPGSEGELFVEGERYNIRRLYTPPDGRFEPRIPRLFGNDVPLGTLGPSDPNLLGAQILAQANWQNRSLGKPPIMDPTNALILDASLIAAQRDLQIQRQQQGILNDARLAERTQAGNVQAIQAANVAIQQLNERILPVLAKVTGQNLGDNHDAWVRWDTDQAGYAYQNSTADKPTFTEVVQLDYQTRASNSCFGAGTTVRTMAGLKRIETILAGDLVLVQDTTRGSLSYQPVLTAFHNPPSSTYKIKLDDDEIVATGIHRFWEAGKGWTMARDLKVGNSLRVLDGVATVRAVEPNQTEPVFNLEVAEGGSFFVGRVGALVHDNSLVAATPQPFDAAPRSLANAR